MVLDGALWKRFYLKRWPTENEDQLDPFTIHPSQTSPLAVPFPFQSSLFGFVSLNLFSFFQSWRDSLAIGSGSIGIESN